MSTDRTNKQGDTAKIVPDFPARFFSTT